MSSPGRKLNSRLQTEFRNSWPTDRVQLIWIIHYRLFLYWQLKCLVTQNAAGKMRYKGQCGLQDWTGSFYNVCGSDCIKSTYQTHNTPSSRQTGQISIVSPSCVSCGNNLLWLSLGPPQTLNLHCTDRWREAENHSGMAPGVPRICISEPSTDRIHSRAQHVRHHAMFSMLAFRSKQCVQKLYRLSHMRTKLNE